jgi:hypothetical protein
MIKKIMFKDLPFGAKFTDDIGLAGPFDYMTKMSDTSYSHEELGHREYSIIHPWLNKEDEVYPILEFMND